jgi:hypothetical protein
MPSTIDLWNNALTDTMRHNTNKTTFKRSLRNIFNIHMFDELRFSLFNFGERQIQIVMSQMRLEFSNLNEHLYNKLCVDSPLCSCKQAAESVQHFFFDCRLYRQERAKLYSSFFNLPITIDPSVSIMLYGIPNESIEDNLALLKFIQSYIKDTHRFE